MVDPNKRILKEDNVGGVYATSMVLRISSMVLPEVIVTPEIIPPTV
jgi:hypothetical protein